MPGPASAVRVAILHDPASLAGRGRRCLARAEVGLKALVGVRCAVVSISSVVREAVLLPGLWVVALSGAALPDESAYGGRSAEAVLAHGIWVHLAVGLGPRGAVPQDDRAGWACLIAEQA